MWALSVREREFGVCQFERERKLGGGGGVRGAAYVDTANL